MEINEALGKKAIGKNIAKKTIYDATYSELSVLPRIYNHF